MVLLTLNALLNANSKDCIQYQRPPIVPRLDDLVGTNYSIPSGHALLPQ